MNRLGAVLPSKEAPMVSRDRTAAIASHQIIGGNRAAVGHGHHRLPADIGDRADVGLEPDLDIGKPRQPGDRFAIDQRLIERIAAGPAERHLGGIDRRQDLAVRRMKRAAWNGVMAAHFRVEPERLERAQASSSTPTPRG
jgi:hypothetical protein